MLRPWLFTIALPLLAACSYPWITPGKHIPVLFFVAFMLSSACVTGIWLGITYRWWRLLVAPFIITLTAFALGYSMGSSFDWTGASISAITSIIIWITLEITKLIFGRFEVPDSRETMTDGLQFGISHLMITTAGVALFISGVQFLSGFTESSARTMSPNIFMIATTFIAVLVIITLAGTWALLGNAIKKKLFIASLASIVAAIAAPFLLRGPSSVLWIGLFFICWIAITLQLWLLRLEGLRFVRK